ncbi:RHS repeat domain-containing protein [Enterobacter cancerogenus]
MTLQKYYTQAENFMSSVDGQVDPRTGLFNANLTLLNLHSTNLTGPSLSLSLSYSPLSFSNDGFGTGFNLNLTKYNAKENKLTLSSGEEYRISNNGTAVKQKKLNNFIFNKIDDKSYKIIHKNGLVEYLSRYNSVYVPVRIADTFGRSIRLCWLDSDLGPRLFKIWDDSATVLCQITYPDPSSNEVILDVLPNSLDSGYRLTFILSDSDLVSVTSNAVTPSLTWSFGYKDVGPGRVLHALTSIEIPTRKKEIVVYDRTGGMTFPDTVGALWPLPRVIQYSILCSDKPALVTYWEYTVENYLGNGIDVTHWRPDHDHMLNFLSHDYFYGSTEKRMDITNDTVIETIIHRYNNYHLLVSESTLSRGKTHTVFTQYHASAGASFDEQPDHFLLPASKTESWQDSRGRRSQLTTLGFDLSGNLLREVKPDGSITEYEYYPAEGEGDACPADRFGFTRYLKKQTDIPFNSVGDEPKTVKVHRWKKYDGLFRGCYAVMPDTIIESIGKREVAVTRVYYDDKTDPLTYGREKERITTLKPDINKSESYVDHQRYTYDSATLKLRQSETLTTFDGMTLNRTTLRDAIRGILLSETDNQGVITSYVYDKAGRVLSHTVQSGSEKPITTTCNYQIASTGPVTIETDPAGNRMKTFLDGMGRQIRQEYASADAPDSWFEISSQQYNALGKLANSSGSDWEPGSRRSFLIETSHAYDGWGNITMKSRSDGTADILRFNPVRMRSISYAQADSAGASIKSGRTITSYSELNYLPIVKIQFSGDSGKPYYHRLQWDGSRRLRSSQDNFSGITTYTYDELGRELTRTLSDGTIISRNYAPHLLSKQVASISVTGKNYKNEQQTWLLGTQEFDGLGRVIRQVSGGRETTFSYTGASLHPTTIRRPSGAVLDYTYAPLLGNSIKSLNAGEIEQTFNYDDKTGGLLSASEGEVRVDNVLFASGALKEETFIRSGRSLNTAFTHTLAGGLIKYTDIAGKVILTERDIYGRISSLTDNDLESTILYDPFGRVAAYSVISLLAMGPNLFTELFYDDLGRERLRIISDNNGAVTRLYQTWLPDGKLEGRKSESGKGLLYEESYEYDSRRRLTKYKVTGTSLPVDGYGYAILSQAFQYDALNNLTVVTTTLADGSSDRATYLYLNEDDPTQLSQVTHTHKNYPPTISLEYDADGQMIRDETGQILTYDALGRLNNVGGVAAYVYDGLNRQVKRTINEKDSCEFFYRGNELVNDIRAETVNRYIKTGNICLGVSTGEDKLIMTACDHHGSLSFSLDVSETEGKRYAWSPYGSGDNPDLLPGYNGERYDPVSHDYPLGNGYRAYSPVLMRFRCPDSLSPFGAGGINPYMYCAGDPVNYTDPTGHISWMGWLGIGLGVLGLGLAIFTGGMSIAAAGGIMGAIDAASTTSIVIGGLGLISDTTAIASGATEDRNPRLSAALGWTSLGTGVAGLSGAAYGLFKSFRAAKAGMQLTRTRVMMIESPRVFGTDEFTFNPHGASAPVQATYTAIDTEAGIRRLNIVAHGNAGIVEMNAGNFINADGLYTLLSGHGVMNQQFDTIRMLICHSADIPNGGTISLAERFAQLAGKPVEGFHGTVTMFDCWNVGGVAQLDLDLFVNNAYTYGGANAATAFMQTHRADIIIGLHPQPSIPNVSQIFNP